MRGGRVKASMVAERGSMHSTIQWHRQGTRIAAACMMVVAAAERCCRGHGGWSMAIHKQAAPIHTAPSQLLPLPAPLYPMPAPAAAADPSLPYPLTPPLRLCLEPSLSTAARASAAGSPLTPPQQPPPHWPATVQPAATISPPEPPVAAH